MPLEHTDSGRIAKFLFYRKVLVWVEGRTDVPFFERILSDCDCLLRPAGGKEECEKLVDALREKGYPYVVILDGDYEVLFKPKTVHDRVILLTRYSTENYLFEKGPVRQICCGLAQVSTAEDVLGSAFEKALETLESGLLELVVLDIAHRLGDTGHRALPDKVQRLLESRGEIAFDPERLKAYRREHGKEIDPELVDQAKSLLDTFLEQHRFVDILRGHFVFSVLRELIVGTVEAARGRRPVVDNDALLVLLSMEVWSIVPTKEHEELREEVRQAVTDACGERSKWSLHSVADESLSGAM